MSKSQICFVLSVGIVAFLQCSESDAFPREMLKIKTKTSTHLKGESAQVSRLLNSGMAEKVNSSSIDTFDHSKTLSLESSFNKLNSTIGTVTSLVTYVSTIISMLVGNVTNESVGLGSLFDKSNLQKLTSLFNKGIDKEIDIGCDIVDPLLIANLPGIFIGVPLVILGISILVGVVAAIVVAIGGLGSHITDSIYEKINDKNHEEGYSPSIQSPVEISGSADTTSYSNSRFIDTINGLSDRFSQGHEKYSALSQELLFPEYNNSRIFKNHS